MCTKIFWRHVVTHIRKTAVWQSETTGGWDYFHQSIKYDIKIYGKRIFHKKILMCRRNLEILPVFPEWAMLCEKRMEEVHQTVWRLLLLFWACKQRLTGTVCEVGIQNKNNSINNHKFNRALMWICVKYVIQRWQYQRPKSTYPIIIGFFCLVSKSFFPLLCLKYHNLFFSSWDDSATIKNSDTKCDSFWPKKCKTSGIFGKSSVQLKCEFTGHPIEIFNQLKSFFKVFE